MITEKEQLFFIKILSDHIHGRPTIDIPDQLDWVKLAQYASSQSLTGIFYVQTQGYMAKRSELRSLFGSLHSGFMRNVFVQVNFQEDMKVLDRQFTENHISYVPMKGEVLKHYYPMPDLRSMGDIDMVIHEEDRKKADDIMMGRGFQRGEADFAVWAYYKGSVHYEIHTHALYEKLLSQFDYQAYFDRIWDYSSPVNADSSRYQIGDSFHFLYLVTHTAKHIINNGMGFRAFLDMVFFGKKAQIDWDWVEKELKVLGLYEFTKICFALCEHWFNVEMPLKTEPLSEEFVDEATAKVFADGIFGLENEENEEAHSAKLMQQTGQTYWKSAFLFIWRKLFPAYKDMRLIPGYTYVDGKPWLMPWAWLSRGFYYLTHQFMRSKDLLSQPLLERKAIVERQKKLAKWGL